MTLPEFEPSRQAVVFDSSALLGRRRLHLLAVADVGYCRGFWSSWIISEVVRNRVEWVAERAL